MGLLYKHCGASARNARLLSRAFGLRFRLFLQACRTFIRSQTRRWLAMRTRFLASIAFALGLASGRMLVQRQRLHRKLAQPAQGAATPARTAGRLFTPGGMSRSVNWSEFGFIPSGGRFNPHERTLSPRNAHRLHKLWSFFTGCNGPICGGSSPAVANGVVYVGS